VAHLEEIPDIRFHICVWRHSKIRCIHFKTEMVVEFPIYYIIIGWDITWDKKEKI
jgi:hypothetical protein